MSELNMMVTILNRSIAKKFIYFCKENEVFVVLGTLGFGTANSEILDYFGLEATEKTVFLSVVTREKWKELKKGLITKMDIDVPGTGISFLVPVSSMGGKKALQFLTEKQEFIKEEERTLKDTKYELLITIANQGYIEMIMDAARNADAAGGTVIHAKGSGMERAEKFFGVSLAAEKEVIFIVAKKEQKNKIMRAIMEKAGIESKAKSIVFSLPVTSIAGLRILEEDVVD